MLINDLINLCTQPQYLIGQNVTYFSKMCLSLTFNSSASELHKIFDKCKAKQKVFISYLNPFSYSLVTVCIQLIIMSTLIKEEFSVEENQYGSYHVFTFIRDIMLFVLIIIYLLLIIDQLFSPKLCYLAEH